MTGEQPPRILLLETSARDGFVALGEGVQVVGERRLEDSRRQARDLAPFVQALLTERGLTPRDLTAVAVSIGPGSYTGLRVGIISAKVLSYATGCRLLGIPTFHLLAAQAPPAARVDVLADAQKDRVYHQSFHVEAPESPQPLSDLTIRTWDHWRASCAPGVVVTGPGAEKFPDRMPEGVIVLTQEVRQPHSTTLLQLALSRLVAGETDDPFQLEPLYLRPSSAEEQWDARRG